jgi:hypothetical protein
VNDSSKTAFYDNVLIVKNINYIDKHCKIIVVYNTYTKKHYINDCDFNIIDKHKKYDVYKNREHIT